MGSIKSACLLAASALLLSSCAATYKSINPPTVEYRTYNDNDDFEFAYQYDVLSYRGNNRYSKKEMKKGYSVVAIKLKNKTDRTLNFARDIEITTSQGIPLLLSENETVAKNLRQGVFGYILYGLLVYREVECVNNECEVTKTIPVGLGIAALNMVIAGSSNSTMRNEFVKYSPFTNDIKPGETVYCIVCFRDIGFQPLSAKLKSRAN